ncbi:MAG: dihydroorotate dehydrogenase electron transfer subunit [Spirochaetae bacterium HGW-Spirochaetae-9]|nr:MAG: dihydroorotate dehydrogenase electron transfer subunit [Spirochaetae bacterium HGW-Spirochaetae-9]
MRQFYTTITLNRDVSPSWKILGFAWPGDLPAPAPGQFFTFRPEALAPGDSGLLRRPLAFAAFTEGRAYALYQVRGTATKALAASEEGSSLDVIGALGNAFPLPLQDERPILLGGGIGIGPILFLHSILASLDFPVARKPALFLGFRSAAFIPDFSALSSDGLRLISESLAEARIATDDGSKGYAGTVVGALAAEGAALESQSKNRPHFYGCGPEPMLAALDTFAGVQGFPAHVSVEQWMACGVGACYGCVVPATKGGYLRACADGPVFKSGDIAWGK